MSQTIELCRFMAQFQSLMAQRTAKEEALRNNSMLTLELLGKIAYWAILTILYK